MAHRCTAVAEYVARACILPPPAWRQMRVVHFKGRHKPWMQLPRPCHAVGAGAVRAAVPRGAAAAGGPQHARVRLERGEHVVWAAGACRLGRPTAAASSAGTTAPEPEEDEGAMQRRMAMTYDTAAEKPPARRGGSSPAAGAGANSTLPVVRWANGQRVAERCCHNILVLKAEWYRRARSVRGWDVLGGVPSF